MWQLYPIQFLRLWVLDDISRLYFPFLMQVERERIAEKKKRKLENEKKSEIVVPVGRGIAKGKCGWGGALLMESVGGEGHCSWYCR